MLALYKKEILLIYSLAVIFLLTIYIVVFNIEGSEFANHWLILSVVTLIIVITQTISRLGLNRLDEKSPPYKILGWGNRATIFRGVLIAVLAGFLFKPWPEGLLIWLPGSIYFVASIIDRLDGYLARITQMQSQLGTELDTVYDAIGLLIAPLLAVSYGQLHWSYLLVSMAYYLFVLGIYMRKFRGLKVNKLSANISRRTIAGFQMGFVAVILLPIFRPPFTQLAGIAFMLPLLFGFLIDWCIVRGSLVQGTGIALNLEYLKSIGKNVLLPGLRLIALVLVICLFNENVIQASFNTLIIILIATFMMVCGFAGRTGAAMLAILMGMLYQDQEPSLIVTTLLFIIIWIMMLGIGRFSLYKRDEDWVNRYDGK
jgi:CDP-diacylglycerol--glycerol-3-phosphate 3-phosphatidyltransferase